MFISQCMRLCVREFIKCVSSYLSDRKWTQYFSLEDHLTDQWCYSFPPTSHSVHSLSLSLSDQIFLSFKHTHTHRTSSNAFYFFKQLWRCHATVFFCKFSNKNNITALYLLQVRKKFIQDVQSNVVI